MVQLENESQKQPLISNKRILQTRPAALSDKWCILRPNQD